MVNQVLLELSLAKISVGTWFNRWSFYFYFVNLLWKKYTPSSHKISILSRCQNAVCSLPKTENFQIPLLLLVGVIIGDLFLQYFYAHRIYDKSPLFGFGDNASGCCAQSVLFPKQKLSNSLVAAGWVVPSVPVVQMHFQDGRSLHWQVGIHNLRVWVSKN